MRVRVAAAVLMMAIQPCLAETPDPAKPEPEKAPKGLTLNVPASTLDCLKTLESVLESALDADLLDDQMEEAELELEKLETACHDQKFNEAIQAAKAIEKLILANK